MRRQSGKLYIYIYYNLLDEIQWEDRVLDGQWQSPNVWVVFAAIDGKFCPIEVNRTVWDIQAPFWSAKHSKHGLKYEVAVHILTGRLVRVPAGGLVGSTHDITTCRLFQILQELFPNECLWGDKGYYGEDRILVPYKGRSRDLTDAEWEWNTFFNAYRVIVKNAIGQIARFGILQHTFRCGIDLNDRIERHKIIFQVCSQLAALDIQLHPVRRDERENPSHWNDPDSEPE